MVEHEHAHDQQAEAEQAGQTEHGVVGGGRRHAQRGVGRVDGVDGAHLLGGSEALDVEVSVCDGHEEVVGVVDLLEVLLVARDAFLLLLDVRVPVADHHFVVVFLGVEVLDRDQQTGVCAEAVHALHEDPLVVFELVLQDARVDGAGEGGLRGRLQVEQLESDELVAGFGQHAGERGVLFDVVVDEGVSAGDLAGLLHLALTGDRDEVGVCFDGSCFPDDDSQTVLDGSSASRFEFADLLLELLALLLRVVDVELELVDVPQQRVLGLCPDVEELVETDAVVFVFLHFVKELVGQVAVELESALA